MIYLLIIEKMFNNLFGHVPHYMQLIEIWRDLQMKLNIPNCGCLFPLVHPPPVHTLQCPLAQLPERVPCLALLALVERGWKQEEWVEDLLLI